MQLENKISSYNKAENEAQSHNTCAENERKQDCFTNQFKTKLGERSIAPSHRQLQTRFAIVMDREDSGSSM